MRTLFLILLFPAFTVPHSNSQAADNAQTAGAIHGTVVDSKTGQPLKGAEVSLRTFSQASRGESNSAVSDAEGHFSFDNLAAGRYRVTASRNGYVAREPRAGGVQRAGMISLSAGQHLDSITLRLVPSAVVAGRVTSEGDEPVPNVLMQAMKYTYQGDKRTLSDAGTSNTNDRGEYRIWGLPPGKYYLRATHPRAGTVRPGSQVYVPVFYPGVTDLSRTQAIELHAGDEITGLDINFVSFRSVRVSGRVSSAGSLPAKEVQVSLVGGSGGMTFSVGQATTDAKGNFEIRGVPPGSYTLVAEQYGSTDPEKVMRGRSSVDVGETNLNDVEVGVGPGASVSGHVRVEGKAVPDLTKLTVALDAQDDLSSLGFSPEVSNVPLRPDGTFNFRDVPEGSYRIKVLPLPVGYYLKPGGEGDAIEAGVKVTHNHAATVELTLSAGAGRLTGSVLRKTSRPFPERPLFSSPTAHEEGSRACIRRLSATPAAVSLSPTLLPETTNSSPGKTLSEVCISIPIFYNPMKIPAHRFTWMKTQIRTLPSGSNWPHPAINLPTD